VGEVAQVLVEGTSKGRWRGRTRTSRLVYFPAENDWLGRLARVRITWAGPWSMVGTLDGAAEEPS